MKIELNEHEALTLYRLLCRWELNSPRLYGQYKNPLVGNIEF